MELRAYNRSIKNLPLKKVWVVLAVIIGITFMGLGIKYAYRLSVNHIKNQFVGDLLIDDYISDNQKNIDILQYNLEFEIFPDEKKIIVSAELKGRVVDHKIESIDLNFYDNYKIKKLLLNGNPTLYENESTRLSVQYNPIDIDTFTLKIFYEGVPKKVGLGGFVFGKKNETSLVYTMSEPIYASSWFPCNDIPTDKSLLDIKITNDSSMVSVSNGVLLDVESKGDRKTYHWKTIYPISTYLIAVYSSKYINFSDKYISLDKKDTMNIEYYVLPDNVEEAKKDFSEHVKILNYFSSVFGEYPFIKEKYGVAEFLWQFGAMEHQTITGFASNLIGGKKFFNDVLIHELAHQWWGDAVGVKSWKDIWLNEGFSSYSEALYFESKSGKLALKSTMMSKYNSNFNGRLSDPGTFLFTNTVYNKGAWALHMLRWEIGDSAFFKILKDYYNSFKYSNSSTDDFKVICEKITGKNLDKFFDQWINGEGEIELRYDYKVSRNGENYLTKIIIEQIQKEQKQYEFSLEVMLEYETANDQYFRFDVINKSTVFEISTDEPPVSVKLDPNKWLLASITKKRS